MWSYIWHTFFFDPVYNTLVFFIDEVPGGDIGLAIIFTTVVVKVVLLPLSLKAARTQHAMRRIDPQLKEIKEKYKDNREQLGREMMSLYREAGVNPFASILLMFIQIPIIISLYYSVYKSIVDGVFVINSDVLYGFIAEPTTTSLLFLGFIDVAARSLPLAALAGITQFIQVNLSMPKLEPRDPEAEPSMKDDFARSMQMQMRYVMPIIIFIFAYSISASIALYFTISNLVGIGQEFIVRRHKKNFEVEAANEL